MKNKILLSILLNFFCVLSALAAPPAGFEPDPFTGTADNTAQYLLLNGSSGILANERVFAPDAADFNWTDGGAGGNYVFSVDHIDFAKGGITGGTTQQSALDALLNLPSVASGDTVYRGATNWVRLPKQNNGDVLTLSSGLPAWLPPSLSLGSDLHFVTTQSEASLSNESVLTGTSNRITVASGATLDIGTDVATLTGSQTLTNKTLTGPAFSRNSGNHLVLKGASFDATLSGADWGQTTTISIPDPASSTANLILNKTNQSFAGTMTFTVAPTLTSNTLTANGNLMTFPPNAQTLVGVSHVVTLTNKKLTAPAFTVGNFVLEQAAGNYTVDWANPGAGRAYTITDVNGSANFAMKDASAYTQGGIAYGDGNLYKTNTAGSSGQPLVSGGTGAPTFASALGQTVGGTGAISWAAGDVLTVNDAGTVVRLPGGSDTNVLTYDSTGNPNIKWAAPASSGHALEEEGVGITQRATLNFVGSGFTASDISTKSTLTLDPDLNTISQLTPTAGDVMVCNDTPAWVDLAGGSNGDFMQYDSTGNPNVKWAALDSDLTTLAGLTATAGNIIVANDSNAWATVAGSGTNGFVLTYQSGGNPNATWAAPALGAYAVTTNSSGFTASYNTVHLIDSSGGTVLATLPTAVGHTGEFVVLSLRTVGNNVTVATTSSQTYDGQASSSIVSGVRYNTFYFISDGANWMIL